ncbi:MAG: hypothetical protein ACMUIE_04740 [Thermoplasmatota archaeon]
MTAPPSTWKAAVCFESAAVARLVRETLDSLEWKYERDRTIHSFGRLWVVISVPAVSYVFQFIVREPVEIVINTFDEKPTHASDLHFIEIKGITRKNAPRVRKLLQEFAGSLPRKPYDFHWKERFRAGFLNRQHMDAKRQWGRWGI